jgi:hypothetical protein
MVAAMLGSLLVMLMLAACGSSIGGTGSQGGQSSPVATKPVQTQNCGTLHSNVAGLVESDKAHAMQDENCFLNAYKQCQPAALTFQSTSLDTGVIHHLAVKSSNGSCSLTDGFQHYIAPNPPGGTITYTCASASMQSDGLHIASCGDAGDILIPLK